MMHFFEGDATLGGDGGMLYFMQSRAAFGADPAAPG